MKRIRGGLFIVILCLCLSSIAFSQDERTSAEEYLEELHSQGKDRVIVIFKDEVVPSLVDKYNGRLIRTFTSIKALVCELPQENIALLKAEESVEDVVPDAVMEVQDAYVERDPEELALFLRLKEEYLAKAKQDYDAALQQAYQEYLRFIKEDLYYLRMYIQWYGYILQWLKNNGYADTSIYNYVLNLYYTKLKEYYTALRNAYYAYCQKLTQAKEAYVTACGEAEVKALGDTATSYTGPVQVRWNNLEAGLNSKAAWDRYGLDGTGIKIAFIDTGINYTLENLDNNYLGGYDFVNDDDDPMPALDQTEDHGTMVASLAVGEGVNKVVGVAYNASYYAVRVLISDAGGGYISDIMAGIEWASTEPHKADIISMSLGTYGGGSGWSQVKAGWEKVCNNAYNNGIILVAGSGNDGYDYSLWPARFDNVISVGAHAEDQTLLDYWIGGTYHVVSNGGVDIIAPGERVYSVAADNSAWWGSGTSYSTPHTSGLIALLLQYARQNNIDVNNGYLWEVMKNGAVDLGLDPVYQGSGKIYAAKTVLQAQAAGETTTDSNIGSIDLMAGSIWPFDINFVYYDYIYLEQDLYPAYFLGTSMLQDLTITNNTNEPGKRPITITNLNLTTIQKYRDTGETLPGNSTADFALREPITLNPGDTVTLPDDYFIPLDAREGLYNTVLDLEFKIQGNDRLLKITHNEASIWCPPGPLPDQTGYGLN